MEKLCKKCGKEKSIDEFHKNKNANDGLDNRCKECCSLLKKNKNKKIQDEINSRRDGNGNIRCKECGELYPENKHYFRNNKNGCTGKCRKCTYGWKYMPKQPEEGFQLCIECLGIYPLNEDYFHHSIKNGFRVKCKKCVNGWSEFEENLQKDVAEGYKRCKSCKDVFPLEPFYFTVMNQYSDGFDSNCKKCKNNWDDFPHVSKEGYHYCNKCKTEYPADDLHFYKFPSGNYQNTCKKCHLGWDKFKTQEELNKEEYIKNKIESELQGMKYCRYCDTYKKANNEYFAINHFGRQGFDNRCKKCVSNYSKEYANYNKSKLSELIFDENILKKCTICKKSKPGTPEYFQLRTDSAKLRSECYDCMKLLHKQYRDENIESYRERERKYTSGRRDIINEYNRIKKQKHYEENKEQIDADRIERQKNRKKKFKKQREARLKYNEMHADEIREEMKDKQRKYYLENKDRINARIRKSTNRYNRKLVKYNSTTFQELSKYQEIRIDPNNEKLGQVKCKNCEQWLNPTNMMIRSRMASINGYAYGDNNTYCSSKCKDSCSIFNQDMYPKGFNNYVIRDVPNWIKEEKKESVGYTCEECGAIEVPLCVHHIDPYILYPQLGCDLCNLKVLCDSCHKNIHHEDGMKLYQIRCENGKIDFSKYED